MPSSLNITSTLSDNIGIMYFDPVTESLKELDSTVYVSCTSFAYSIKRFYLCGSLLEYNSVVQLNVSTTDSDLYTVKIRYPNNSYSILPDYDTSTDQLIINSSVLGDIYVNAIPIDVLIQSNTVTEKSIDLVFSLVTEDLTQNAVCTIQNSTLFYDNNSISGITTGRFALKIIVNSYPSNTATFDVALFSGNIGHIITDLLTDAYLSSTGNKYYTSFDVNTFTTDLTLLGMSSFAGSQISEANTITLVPLTNIEIMDLQTTYGTAIYDILNYVDTVSSYTVKSCSTVVGSEAQ